MSKRPYARMTGLSAGSATNSIQKGGTICRLVFMPVCQAYSRKADKERDERQRRNHCFICLPPGGKSGQHRAPRCGKRRQEQSCGYRNRKQPHPRDARVKTRGKSSRRSMATCSGYGPGGCKTKYTGSQGSPARCQGVGCADKWQIQKQKPAYGPAFFNIDIKRYENDINESNADCSIGFMRK